MNPWTWSGQQRPSFAQRPGPGCESVWDYPRPPRVSADTREVVVRHAGRIVAESRRAQRVLETASPPTFYLPAADVDLDRLAPAEGNSWCEWKGAATYWSLRDTPGHGVVAWQYRQPLPAFAALAGYLAFYPARVECTVEGERVRPQPGGFYGGWITSELAGPFKGDPGTGNW